MGGNYRVQEAGFRVQEVQKAESRQQKAGTARGFRVQEAGFRNCSGGEVSPPR
jgi:hypothetical protein